MPDEKLSGGVRCDTWKSPLISAFRYASDVAVTEVVYVMRSSDVHVTPGAMFTLTITRVFAPLTSVSVTVSEYAPALYRFIVLITRRVEAAGAATIVTGVELVSCPSDSPSTNVDDVLSAQVAI